MCQCNKHFSHKIHSRQHSSVFKVLTHQENALHVYFHSPGPIFSKMNFWARRGIRISEILEMQGYRTAERLLYGREAATSRWVGTIKETSCLKPAALRLTSLVCSPSSEPKLQHISLHDPEAIFFSTFIEVLKRILPNTKFFTEEVGRSSLESTQLIFEGLCFQWRKHAHCSLSVCSGAHARIPWSLIWFVKLKAMQRSSLYCSLS